MKVLLLNAGPKKQGATTEILLTLQEAIRRQEVEMLCLGEQEIAYCQGCKSCYTTKQCVLQDDMRSILAKIDSCDALVIAAPSWWADIPGQFKVFIDRCTPYGVTDPSAEFHYFRPGKKCYAIALRAGVRPMECEHIIESIAHWCGHMGIEVADSLYFCRINDKNDIEPHKETLRKKAAEWFGE